MYLYTKSDGRELNIFFRAAGHAGLKIIYPITVFRVFGSLRFVGQTVEL